MTTDPILLEISALALALHPREFLLRLHDWRSNGFGPGGMSEQVSRSSTYPIPVTQPTNSEGNPTGPPRYGDAMDRELQQAARAFKDSIDDAVRLLRTANALQTRYLYEIAVASDEALEAVSDARSCMRCGLTVEMHQRAERKKARKSTFRIKRGVCEACYKAWQRAECPDMVAFCRREESA